MRCTFGFVVENETIGGQLALNHTCSGFKEEIVGIQVLWDFKLGLFRHVSR